MVVGQAVSRSPIAAALASAVVLGALWRWLNAQSPIETPRAAILSLVLAAVVATVPCVPAVAPPAPRTRRLLLVAAVAVILVGVLDLLRAWELAVPMNDLRSPTLDIAANTDCAASSLLRGENPYATRCQRKPVRPDPARGITLRPDRHIALRGVRYRYGYPYYPLMALAFLPARALEPALPALRHTIVAALVATLVTSALLARALAPPGYRALAWCASTAALVANSELGFQSFEQCVTDVVIAPTLLLAVAAASRRRFARSGVLAGLTLGFKLIPGAFLVFALALAASTDPRAARRFVVAAGLTATTVLAPAVVAGPADFFSATLLFYAIFHGVEGSSLAWWVPDAARPLWFATAAALVAWALRGARRGDGASALRAFLLADLIFLGMNKRCALNYFAPLGPALLLLPWARLGTVALPQSPSPPPQG